MSEEYPAWPKIPRLHRDVYITEKVDGTNGLVSVLETDDVPWGVRAANGLTVTAGSRSRWISPDQDNFGFAAWVETHADELAEMGPGHHYGEYYGRGIQRGYGLPGKRFALFNVARWADERPECCDVVPLLGIWNAKDLNLAVNEALYTLRATGSAVAPGFMLPEGIVIYHAAGNQHFKVLLEGDSLPKTLAPVPAVLSGVAA